MKIYVLFAQRACQYHGQYAPEVIAAVDEYTHDVDPGRLEAQLAVEADKEFVSAAVIGIQLDEAASKVIEDRLSGQTTVIGAVE